MVPRIICPERQRSQFLGGGPEQRARPPRPSRFGQTCTGSVNAMAAPSPANTSPKPRADDQPIGRSSG